MDKLLDKIRQQLSSRGAKTIRTLGRAFRILDNVDGNRKVDTNQFFYGLRDFGCNLTKDQAIGMMKLFDRNGDGVIDFDQFLYSIRGKPNSKRQAIIDKAYLKFDTSLDGKITIADLKGHYNCSFHPKVQNGQMSQDQVFLQFLQQFGDVNKDGTISRQQWNDYYAAVSSSVDNDDHFVQIMKIVWKIE